MSKTMKRVSALLLAMLMIVTFMPMTQEVAFAAAKKPAKVKGLKVKVSGNKMTISWKKAKNAKKYSVSIKDNSTKLTATKSTKKKKLTVPVHYGTKYTISVKGVNGKKKGKAAKKSVTVPADPNAVSKEDYDTALKALEIAIEEYMKLYESNTATEAQLKQAEKNFEEAAKQYNKMDMAVREELAKATELAHDDWNKEVKDALNAMIAENAGKANKYVVFDYDNTCSIFDVEEQLAVYQLQVMAFDETVTPDKLAEILATGIAMDLAVVDNDGLADSENNYQDWIDDITAAYQRLLDKGWKFTPAGLSKEDQAKIQEDDDWKEFATKMRAMYDVVFATESADVAYPWVLYWFTGMSHDEVYELAKASHTTYKLLPSTEVKWTAPEVTGAKVKGAHYKWTSGTNVSQNIVELMAALHNNGIKVWVCSASATDPIRAAIDVFGQHDVVDGMMAMTNVYEDGKFVNEYDYTSGCAWFPQADGSWKEGTVPTKAQTQGKGKVTAVQNVCGKEYGCGPIAGFMDSTGDFNFCTEFKDLEVVCCFNRASRKVTDGGGLIAELAVYQADTMYANATDKYQAAKAAGDTLYVLQGREENGFRGLRPERKTLRLGATETKLFANADNQAQLDYIIKYKMSTEDALETFAIKTSADDPDNPLKFKYGFLKKYDGYHSQTGDALDAITALSHPNWNPEVRDAINDMMVAEHDNDQYVVFDFDNTCSIFDVEEQLGVYQLQVMAFDETVTPDKLEEILKTDINMDLDVVDNDGLATSENNYQDWIDDIKAAYQKLLDKGYKFTPAGLSAADQAAIQADEDWKEFATKMRALYDVVFATESADVAYPWILYWFTGMTHEEVYNLAKASHTKYKAVETSEVTWTAPELADAKVKGAHYKWTSGTQVSDNIVELMKALDQNGIDVWVCSASATDPIRAAIDVWGLHDYVTGMMAMTNVYVDNAYVNKYDYVSGMACLPIDGDPTNAGWEYGDTPTKAQTQGVGKSDAIQNVLYPLYDDHGPIAGFMDSTGDFNFCSEFDTLQVVCCFNRASRKTTDGGGLIAEMAVYEADDLGYNYAKAQAYGDTLYVLQGRDENGYRGLLPQRETHVYGSTDNKLWRDKESDDDNPNVSGNYKGNTIQYDYIKDNKMSVEDALNKFAIKTKWDQSGDYGYKYGFLKVYSGYHSKA